MRDAQGRRELVGLTREELVAELAAIGEKPFRAKQLWHWIYHQGVRDFAAMSSIARPLQEKLTSASASAAPAWRWSRPAPTAPASGCSSEGRPEGRDRLHPR
jgi:hypothetical protein